MIHVVVKVNALEIVPRYVQLLLLLSFV